MRIPANENFPLDAVVSLRAEGHDVWWVRSEAPGMTDRDVLNRATLDDRLIVTFDKDFGELAFHSHLPVKTGIVLFRVQAPSSEQLATFENRVISSREDWFGYFAVVDQFRGRLRPLSAETLLRDEQK